MKKIICWGMFFLMTFGVLFMAACGENAPPPAAGGGASNPPETAPPNPPESGPERPPEQQAPELSPDETMEGITILTFTAENYMIEYPNYWSLEESGETSGYEVLTFWKKDPDVYEDGGKGILDPNSAKVSLSILAKDGRNLSDIALAELDFTEEDLHSENLDIGGKKAIRYISVYGEDQIINTYIDWNETDYIWLAGYHGTGSERDTMHRDVLFIHSSLQAAGTAQAAETAE